MEYLRIISDILNLSNLSQRLRKNSFDTDRSLDIVQFIVKMIPTTILNWYLTQSSILDTRHLSNLTQRLRKDIFDTDRSSDTVQFIIEIIRTMILKWFLHNLPFQQNRSFL